MIVESAVVVALADVAGERQVLLVRRDTEPDGGLWELPGGPRRADEHTAEAAQRGWAARTDLPGASAGSLAWIGVYGSSAGDPRGPASTYAYRLVLDRPASPWPGHDPAPYVVRWVPVRQALTAALAFDHGEILADAVATDAGVDVVTVLRQALARIAMDELATAREVAITVEEGDYALGCQHHQAIAYAALWRAGLTEAPAPAVLAAGG